MCQKIEIGPWTFKLKESISSFILHEINPKEDSSRTHLSWRSVLSCYLYMIKIKMSPISELRKLLKYVIHLNFKTCNLKERSLVHLSLTLTFLKKKKWIWQGTFKKKFWNVRYFPQNIHLTSVKIRIVHTLDNCPYTVICSVKCLVHSTTSYRKDRDCALS